MSKKLLIPVALVFLLGATLIVTALIVSGANARRAGVNLISERDDGLASLSARCAIDLSDNVGAPYSLIDVGFVGDASTQSQLDRGELPIYEWNGCRDTVWEGGYEYRVSELTISCGASTLKISQKQLTTRQSNLISAFTLPCTQAGENRASPFVHIYSCSDRSRTSVNFESSGTKESPPWILQLGAYQVC